jgi:Acyl transferase domain
MLAKCLGRSISCHRLKQCISVQNLRLSGTCLGKSTDNGKLAKLKMITPGLNMQIHSQVADFRKDMSSSGSVQADSQITDRVKLKRGLPRHRRRQVRKMTETPQYTSNASDGSQQPELEFPSDISDRQRIFDHADDQNPARHAYRPKIDPSETSLILFPGQGSQFVGMGAKLLDYPNVIDMFDTAQRILGYDLLEICLRGPKEALQKTVVSQPAVLVTSLAAVEKLKSDNPWVSSHC